MKPRPAYAGDAADRGEYRQAAGVVAAAAISKPSRKKHNTAALSAHAQPIRQFPGSAQSDGRAAAFRKALNISKDIGGCTINGQRCWKFGGFGHNRVMAAAALQHMHRVFIRS